MSITTLKRRPEFLRVRGGGRASTPAFVIEGKSRAGQPVPPDAETSTANSPVQFDGPRFGFTVTKKIGNAVVRNKIRRRLKAALGNLEPNRPRPDFDYVIIAREAAFDCPFTELEANLRAALARVHDDASSSKGGTKRPPKRASSSKP